MNESLDSRQLLAFVTLSKTGSYTDAAKQLFLTHSAVSHSMKALEHQVGCRLLSRLRKKTVLTEAGEAFLHHARRALEEMRQARITVAELNKWGSRRLRLVADPAVTAVLLVPALVKFHREFPQFRLHVDMTGADDPACILENNRADLVLTEKPPADNSTTFIPLLADRFHFVVNPAHPLAAGNAVSRKELAKQPCLQLRSSSHGRKQMDGFLSQRGMGLTCIGEIESVETIKEMVRQLPVMSLLPGWTVAKELKNQTLISLPSGRKPFEQTWGIIHSPTRPLNHAEATFLKYCRQQIAELG